MTLDIDLDAAAHKRAEAGAFGTERVIAVDGAEVVPEGVSGRLKMVFYLDDTRRRHRVVRQVTEFERNASPEVFGVDNAVDGGAGITGDQVALVIKAISAVGEEC